MKKAEALLEGRQGHRDLHLLCRPGFAALLARPQSATAERGLCRDRDRLQGRRGARADQGAAGEGGRRGRADRSARARRPLQFRPAGRLPGPVPRDRPRRQHRARHRLQGARRHAAEPERHGAAARLERAVALPEARGRPGPRPRARPDPAGRLAGARHADLGRAGHDHPRRHREGRRGRPRGAVRTARSRPRRRPHRDLAQRRRRAAAADRQDRICPRGADHVAAQPRHGDHGARRRRRRRAGARRHQPDLAQAAGNPRPASSRPTGSSRAARSRNPPRAMPRSSCCFR